MKTIPKTRSWILAALIVAVALSLSVSAQDRVEFGGFARALPRTNPHVFVGTWIVQTTITNCSGTTLESFSKLLSINAGGTTTDTSSSSLYRSAGLGIWEHNRHGDFAYAQRFFRFNPDGTPAGSVRAKWIVSTDADGDSYTATGAIQIVLPNGNVVANLCGTEVGTRMVMPE